MQKIVHIVAELSKTDEWNKESQIKEEIYFAREDFRNILDYCGYSRLLMLLLIP